MLKRMDTERNFNRGVQGFMAVVITIGFFGVIAGLMFSRELPTTTKDILLVMLGALLASFKELTGYFFGSSMGSTAKDTALAEAVNSAPTVSINTAASLAATTATDVLAMPSTGTTTTTTVTTKEIHEAPG